MSWESTEWLNSNTLIGFTAGRGKAWHYRAGATNHHDGAVPVEEVRKLLDWQPTVRPLTYEWAGLARSTDRIMVLHPGTGDLLGVHSDGYRAHPYGQWLITQVETLLGDGLAVGSAGLLRRGAQAWVQVEVPETVDVPSVGERIRPSLLASTSLDGSMATTYRRVITRVVCDNTLSMGLAEKTAVVKVRHTSGSTGRLHVLTARDALGVVFSMAEEFAAAIEALAARTVTEPQWGAFLAAHFGERPAEAGRSRTMYDTRIDALHTLWRTDERVAPWAGTAWGVVNAVNTYRHHEGIVRGMARPLRNMSMAIDGTWDDVDAATLATLDRVLAE